MMDDDVKEVAEEAVEQAVRDEAQAGEGAPAGGEGEEKGEEKGAVEEPLAAELAAAKERYLRLLADVDNMRKRQARELEERTARANERLLVALMPVFDHFEMALEAAGAGDAFAQGVRMIAEEFRRVLEQSGAEVIEAQVGAVFDPMAHEALTMAPAAGVPKGCVVSQFRKGWRLGGKVIRPAQVVVSAGEPAEAAPEEKVGQEEA